MISAVLVRVNGGGEARAAVEHGTVERIRFDGCWLRCFGRHLESITLQCADGSYE